MNNRLIILGVVCVLFGLPIILQGLLWWRVSSGVSQHFENLRNTTNNFVIVSYQSTYAWLWGDVGIKELTIVPSIPGFFPHLRVENLSLSTRNPLDLLALAQIGPDRPPPNQLAMRWRNLRLDSTELMNLGTNMGNIFLDPAPGCQADQPFSSDVLTAMRFDALQFDGTAEFILNKNRNRLLLHFDQTLRNAQQLAFRLELSTDDLSGTITGLTNVNWYVAEVSLKINDVGYGDLKTQFCSETQNIPLATFLADQRERAEIGFQLAGLNLSQNAKVALLEGLPRVNIEFNGIPKSPVPVANLLLNSRRGLAGILNAEISIGGLSIPDADIGFDPMIAMRASRQVEQQRQAAARAALDALRKPLEKVEELDSESSNPSTESTPFTRGPSIEDVHLRSEEKRQKAIEAAGFVAVSPSDLAQHSGRQVRLRLVNNRRYEGIIEEVNNDTLRLQISSGGQANIPIPLQRISEALVNLRINARTP